MNRIVESEEERAAVREALAREHAKNMLELYHHDRRAAQLGATFALTLALLARLVAPSPWRHLIVAFLALSALWWVLRRWRCHGCGKLPLLPASVIHHLWAPFNPPGCPRCGCSFRG
jgi:hypothetical protein